MSPDETVTFFGTQAERAEKGVGIAVASGNVQLLALNVRQVFKSRLMRGLVLWKRGNDPRDEFASAVSVVEKHAQRLIGAECDIPVETAQLVAVLLGRGTSMSFRARTEVGDEDQLDWLLAQIQPGSSQDEHILSAISRLGSTERTALAAESYSTYFEIVRTSGEEELTELVEKAELLFARRARDEYFTGGAQSEGGGRDNALVVDYRLAVALSKAGYKGTSAHTWRWSCQ